MTVLGLIPARGGSKRFPKKNLALFDGRPLLVGAILDGWRLSQSIGVAVSTDDDEIAWVATQYGAMVIRRPAELATDDAEMIEVLRHALAEIPADILVLLQPTSPLRLRRDIERTLAPVAAGDASAAFTVCPPPHPNGAVYAWTRAAIESGVLYPQGAAMIEMPPERSVDIDRPLDLEIARYLVSHRA